MAGFVPTFFSNFASSFLEIQDKDAADGKRSVTFANNVPGDVKLESGIVLNPGKPAAGFLRRVFPLPYSIGTLDAKVTTENSLNFDLTNTTCVDKVTLGVNAGFNPSPAANLNEFGESCYLGVSAKHSREYVAGSVGLRTAFKNDNFLRGPIVDASLSVGYKGVSVGGAASVDTSSQALTSSGFGVEYVPNGDLTISAVCNDVKTDKPEPKSATVSAFYKLDAKTQLGVGVDVQGPVGKEDGLFSNLNSAVVTAVTRFQIDPLTSMKFRYSTSHKLSGNVNYALANPKANVAIGITVDPRERTLKGAEWGVNVTLGDY